MRFPETGIFHDGHDGDDQQKQEEDAESPFKARRLAECEVGNDIDATLGAARLRANGFVTSGSQVGTSGFLAGPKWVSVSCRAERLPGEAPGLFRRGPRSRSCSPDVNSRSATNRIS